MSKTRSMKGDGVHEKVAVVLFATNGHMRVSVPGIPKAILNAKPLCSTIHNADEAIERLSRFVEGGNVAVITGAGVSVDSGIRAYRGKDGRYANPNYMYVHHLLTNCVSHQQKVRSSIMN